MREYIVREVSGPVGSVKIKREVIGELIRCRECRHWNTDSFEDPSDGYCYCLGHYWNGDNFCSLAARR